RHVKYDESSKGFEIVCFQFQRPFELRSSCRSSVLPCQKQSLLGVNNCRIWKTSHQLFELGLRTIERPLREQATHVEHLRIAVVGVVRECLGCESDRGVCPALAQLQLAKRDLRVRCPGVDAEDFLIRNNRSVRLPTRRLDLSECEEGGRRIR